MAEILTIEKLVAHSERTVVLPLLSAAIGTEQTVRVRRVSSAEHLSLIPPDPPEAEEWAAKEYARKFREWFDALPAPQQEARRVAAREATLRLVALAQTAPKITVDQARLLGNDAATVAGAVLEYSGLLLPPKRRKAKDAAADAPPPAAEPTDGPASVQPAGDGESASAAPAGDAA